jgi:hypothetical protein
MGKVGACDLNESNNSEEEQVEVEEEVETEAEFDPSYHELAFIHPGDLLEVKNKGIIGQLKVHTIMKVLRIKEDLTYQVCRRGGGPVPGIETASKGYDTQIFSGVICGSKIRHL